MSQMARASLSEVVVDTGMIQSAEMPRGMLVTVEKMPLPVEVVLPEYPVWAKKREVSGVVWVKARIDENGNVIDAQILSSSIAGMGFEESATEAALRSKYSPAEANGIRLPVWIVYPVRFVYKTSNP
jgi:TonB family protein